MTCNVSSGTLNLTQPTCTHEMHLLVAEESYRTIVSTQAM